MKYCSIHIYDSKIINEEVHDVPIKVNFVLFKSLAMRNFVVFSMFLCCLTTSIIADSENDLGAIKSKMVDNFCFKFSCLDTKSIDGKLIVKHLKLWQKEIEFIKLLLETLNACRDLNDMVNLLELLNFAEGLKTLNQLLQTIIDTKSDATGMEKLKRAANVLKGNNQIFLSNEMRMIVKNYIKPVSIISKAVSGKFVLEVTGKHMTMSKVIPLVEPFLSTISDVYFFDAEVIHIDTDLLKSIWNSKTIDMKAKIIHVHKSVEWDLSGNNGNNNVEEDRHGKNGGLIFIRAEELINGNLLKIILNGGDGRNGQEAGQITDGIDGESVTYSTLEKATDWVWYKNNCVNDGGVYKREFDGMECEYLCHLVPSTEKHHVLTVCYGKDRTPPRYQSEITCGNAGLAGMAIITINRSFLDVNIINKDGEEGKNKDTQFKSKVGRKGQDRASMNISKIPGFIAYSSGDNENFSMGSIGHDDCNTCVWNHPKSAYYCLIHKFSPY